MEQMPIPIFFFWGSYLVVLLLRARFGSLWWVCYVCSVLFCSVFSSSYFTVARTVRCQEKPAERQQQALSADAGFRVLRCVEVVEVVSFAALIMFWFFLLLLRRAAGLTSRYSKTGSIICPLVR